MYALVRFISEFGNSKHAIPVEDIRDFDPRNELDFDNRKKCTAPWTDAAYDINTVVYDVQVLLLDLLTVSLFNRKYIYVECNQLLFECKLYMHASNTNLILASEQDLKSKMAMKRVLVPNKSNLVSQDESPDEEMATKKKEKQACTFHIFYECSVLMHCWCR